MAKDLTLVNPSGTVVTLTDDAGTFDPVRHVFSRAVEQDFRDAGYRDVEKDEILAPQHWQAVPAEDTLSFSERALGVPAGVAVDDGGQ